MVRSYTTRCLGQGPYDYQFGFVVVSPYISFIIVVDFYVYCMVIPTERVYSFRSKDAAVWCDVDRYCILCLENHAQEEGNDIQDNTVPSYDTPTTGLPGWEVLIEPVSANRKLPTCTIFLLQPAYHRDPMAYSY